jgi:uncharacterized membrane protein
MIKLSFAVITTVTGIVLTNQTIIFQVYILVTARTLSHPELSRLHRVALVKEFYKE